MLPDADVKYINANANDGAAAKFSLKLVISGMVDGTEKTYSYTIACGP